MKSTSFGPQCLSIVYTGQVVVVSIYSHTSMAPGRTAAGSFHHDGACPLDRV